MPANNPYLDVVGVIKGRFQIPYPHEGHFATVEEVLKRHRDVLLILGTTYDSTIRDPYPFEIRRMMLQEMFPSVTIVEEAFISSSYEHRSNELTALIRAAFPGREAIIYGARESIVHTYKGVFPVVELPTLPQGLNATEVRESIPYRNSVEFREGYARAIVDRKPIPYPAVDVAPIWANVREVLLISKPEDEGKLRFAGVFYNPELDNSFEDAAWRCVKKELGGINVGSPVIAGSRKIFDPRYRKTRDGVVTTIVRFGYNGEAPAPGPGIERVVWVPMWYGDAPDFIIDMHKPLAEVIGHHWSGC